MEIDFASLFASGANSMEIYLASPSSTKDVPDIKLFGGNNQLKGPGVLFREYYFKDIICIYDKTTDAQKVVRRTLIKDFHVGNLYVTAFREDHLPPFMFPCTKDLSGVVNIEKRTMRLSNRLQIVQDTENDEHKYMYIRYCHSDNVDMSKQKEDINDAIRRLLRYA